MALVQIIDLAVGLYDTATGTITLSVSAFPMFNAAVFTLLLLLWSPVVGRQTTTEADEVPTPS